MGIFLFFLIKLLRYKLRTRLLKRLRRLAAPNFLLIEKPIAKTFSLPTRYETLGVLIIKELL